MKTLAAFLTILFCGQLTAFSLHAQSYFLLPNETEITSLYTAAEEITSGLEKFQTPTTWKSGKHRLVARIVDFRDGTAFFEGKDGVVVGVEKSKLATSHQDELTEFESLLKRRSSFVDKHKLEPQIVKLYADLQRSKAAERANQTRIEKLQGMLDEENFAREAAENNDGANSLRLVATPLTDTIYVMKGSSRSFIQEQFIPTTLDGKKPIRKAFSLRGQPVIPKFSSDNESILAVREDSDKRLNLIFSGAGQVNLTVSVSRGISVTRKFEVIELPFAKGTDSDEIIDFYGIPNSKEKHFVEWPNSVTIDRIFYSPVAGKRAISCEHWRFNNQPGLVVSIVDNKLFNAGFHSK